MTGCQYLGKDYDPRTHQGPTPYCGAKTIEGKSYCHEHYYVVYQKGSAVAGRKKEKMIEQEIAEIAAKQEIDELESM